MADSIIPPQPLEEETVSSFARWVASAARAVETVPGAVRESGASDDAGRQGANEVATDVAGIRKQLIALSESLGEPVVEAVPRHDPQRVCEISSAILSPYQVRRGHVELSGCALEPRPFLRLTFTASQPDRLVHLWFGDDGSQVDHPLVKRLQLDQLDPTLPKLRASDVAMVERWIDAAWRNLRNDARESIRWQRKMLVGATIAWCRRATGKVAVVFPEGPIAEIPFDGWAADFRSGHDRPAPYRCPLTGLESYQIVALPDGTVTVPQAIAPCAHSGQEALRERLSGCEVTGQRVLPEYLVSCAVTGRQVLADAADQCLWCQRNVVPGELDRGLCGDCRRRRPIGTQHPLLQSVLQRYPQYTRFGGWAGWADDSHGVFLGKRRLREIVLICDAENAALLRVGRRWRPAGTWQMESP